MERRIFKGEFARGHGSWDAETMDAEAMETAGKEPDGLQAGMSWKIHPVE